MLGRVGRGRKEGGLDRHRDLNPRTQMRVARLRLNRCGCIPRIAKVVDPLDIARVLASTLADVGRLVSYCPLRGPQ
jgi:hypothetical protein